MRILGVDPGLNTTGYGVIEMLGREIVLLEGGTIRGGSSQVELQTRLSSIYDGIVEVIQLFKPEALALEQLYSHYEHPTTAILMGHARGVICLAAVNRNIPLYSYASTRIKSSLTGSGRASKEQMQKAIQAMLKLKEVPQPHDVADALAVAICHYWTVTSPVMDAVAASRDQDSVGKSRRPKAGRKKE